MVPLFALNKPTILSRGSAWLATVLVYGVCVATLLAEQGPPGPAWVAPHQWPASYPSSGWLSIPQSPVDTQNDVFYRYPYVRLERLPPTTPYAAYSPSAPPLAGPQPDRRPGDATVPQENRTFGPYGVPRAAQAATPYYAGSDDRSRCAGASAPQVSRWQTADPAPAYAESYPRAGERRSTSNAAMAGSQESRPVGILASLGLNPSKLVPEIALRSEEEDVPGDPSAGEKAPAPIESGTVVCPQCSACIPRWASWYGDCQAIGFRRSSPSHLPVILDTTTSYPAVDAGDFSFDHRLGIRAGVRREDCNGRCLELTYLGVDGWSDCREALGAMELAGPGFDLAVDPGVFVVENASSLHGAGVNVWKHASCNWSWLAGFRYFRFNDRMGVSELNAPFDNALEVDCANNLYGLQLGANWLIREQGRPLRVMLGAQAGIYGNDATTCTRSSLIGPPVSAHECEAAFVGQLDVTLEYQLSDQLQVRAGYQVLGFSGVALAPEQLPSTDMSITHGEVRVGSLLLDGGFFGVTLLW